MLLAFLFLASLFLASPAWAIWAVRGDGGGNDATCTNQATDALAHANGCETFAGFLSRSSGTGRTVKFQCGRTHRYTAESQTDDPGDAANWNTVGMYGEGGGATCTSPAEVTAAQVATGWTLVGGTTNIYQKNFGAPVHEWGLAFRVGDEFEKSNATVGQFDRQAFDSLDASA